MRTALCAILSLSLASPALAQLVDGMSQALYESAVRNQSASPSYVLATFVDGQNGRSWTGCVTSTALAALVAPGGGRKGAGGNPQAVQTLLDNRTHTFKTPDQGSFDALQTYSPADLTQERQRLSALSLDQLAAAGNLRRLDGLGPAATACALLERGLPATLLAGSGQLVAHGPPSR